MVRRHSRSTLALFTAALILSPFDGCAMGGTGDTRGVDDGVQLVPAFEGLRFTRPVDLQAAPGRPGELFVVEQAGRIHVFQNDAAVDETSIFMDITGKVNDRGNEEGLLGLAFHPDFETNGYFFVNYTADNRRRTVVERYQVDSGDPTKADLASAKVIIEINQPFGNHNGGQIAFGPDGYLYIGMGDGGSGGDPIGHGQNPTTLLGSMLRIDVDAEADGKAYRIPADNPFVGSTEGRDEVYAYGLRNPWRFSFDPETDRLWAADVGQNAVEEVSIIENGGNYGWKVMEGSRCYDPREGCDRSGLALPVTDYDHNLGISITGGYVYRGSSVPALRERYVFGDYGSGRVWALTENDSGDFEREQLFDTNLAIASFGVDANRELYICAFDGKIYKFAAES